MRADGSLYRYPICRLPSASARQSNENSRYPYENKKMQPTVWAVNLKNGLAALFLQKTEVLQWQRRRKSSISKCIFDGNQDAKEVFAEVIAQKIRDTKTKDKLAIMKDKQYNDYELSNLKSA